MVNHPEFYAHGRYPILPEASLLWEFISPWEFIPPFQEWGPVAGGLTCTGLLALLAAGVWRLNWPAWRQGLKPAAYLGLSSLTLYFLARLFLLQLFVPDRYLVSAHVHAVGVGFVMFMILGVALWLFPKPTKEDTRYQPARIEVAYWFLVSATGVRLLAGRGARPGRPARWRGR